MYVDNNTWQKVSMVMKIVITIKELKDRSRMGNLSRLSSPGMINMAKKSNISIRTLTCSILSNRTSNFVQSGEY